MNNIKDINNFDKCTSCGMCEAICPVNAIEIEFNKDGFYRPKLDENKCISCGKCKKICYRFDDEIKETNQEEISSYSAVNKDEELLKNSSSGAISEELMKECIRQGYIVVGVEYDLEKDLAISSICSDISQLKKYRGSKYFQSYTVEALKIVVKNRKNKYAIFGTPCHIYTLRKYSELNNLDNLFLVDIFCHGVPSMNLWKSYIKGFRRPFKELNFRTKDYGWHNYCNRMVDSLGKEIFSRKNKDKFYDLFFSKLCFNEACYKCKLRSTVAYSDVRLGDFWGPRYIGNTSGVSAITINSKKGHDIIKNIFNNLVMEEVSFNEIISSQFYEKRREYDTEKRKKILFYLNSSQINEAHTYYVKSLSKKTRLKNLIKGIVKLLPISIQSKIRSIVGRKQNV